MIDRADEQRHEPGPEPFWTEAWSLDFFTGDGSLGAAIEMALLPNLGRTAFSVAIVGVDRPLVSLVEAEAGLPTPSTLELRAPGLWTELMCQSPMDHFTFDLEAFAVALDDPDDVYRGALGHRTPIGGELEWETSGDVDVGRNAVSYEMPCVVHGELLLGDATLEIDGWGWRSHRWGLPLASDWSALRGRRHDGDRWHQFEGPLPDVTTAGRAPMPVEIAGVEHRLDQRLVGDGHGGHAWVRSATR